MPRQRRRRNTRRTGRQQLARSRPSTVDIVGRYVSGDHSPRNPLPLPRLRSQARRLNIARALMEEMEVLDGNGRSSPLTVQSNDSDDSDPISDESVDPMSPGDVILRLPLRDNLLSDDSDDEMFEGFGVDDEEEEMGMDRFAEVIIFLESGDLLNDGGPSAPLADDCQSDDGELLDPCQRELRGSMPEPSISLHAAALRGNTKELKRWRNWQIGHCGKNAQQDPPLHCAARAGDVATVEQLLEQGASVTSTNSLYHSPLEIAARHGHIAVVKTLLKHGAGVHADEMDRAYEATKSWAVVETLRTQDSVNLREAPLEQSEKTAPWVSTMLFRVVQKGRVNMLKGLVNLGANLNCNGILGWTPLQIAVRRGHSQCVSTLLEGGADVNGRDDFKWTALHYAAREGHHEIAIMLLEAGADVNAKCRSGRTPIAIACDDATRHLIQNYKNRSV